MLLVLHLSEGFINTPVELVGRDINITLIVQYVGIICGLMGLAFGFLGFFSPGGGHFRSIRL